VQVAVDEKHRLIVASEVVNDGNDTGQLYEMAKAAKEALGTQTLEVVADTGYYNGSALKDCEENGIVAYVPPVKRTGRLEAQGRFTHENFAYDAEEDVYRCPAGVLLMPTKSPKINGSRREIVYLSRKSTCDACPSRARCLSAKADTRTIYRWEHQDVIDRHRVRMENVGARMRQRACLVEHPFGTLKCRAGYRHFLVRGFNKVRGEWSLMALCYNFSRVLSILGFQGFVQYLARRLAERAFFVRSRRQHPPHGPRQSPRGAHLRRIRRKIGDPQVQLASGSLMQTFLLSLGVQPIIVGTNTFRW
jgi:hypothetical protein